MSRTHPIAAVAIVHCHFERGGVTQVVQNHAKCLLPNTHVVLVSGGRTSGLSSELTDQVVPIRIPELDYDRLHVDDGKESIESQARRLAETLDGELRTSGMDPNTSVLHWHNHSLGKNAASPLVIGALAEAGWRLMLQIHDFAEDQRPENYLHLHLSHADLDRVLYPHHPRISYAVLTAGDRDTLTLSGIDPGRVHVIPNSVDLPAIDAERSAAMNKISRAFGVDTSAKWLLYPVRGIRRKNVGEFLLICHLLHRSNPGEFWGSLTLRPTTPVEAASYDRWKSIAARYAANVVFDTGHHPDITFADNLAACHCVVSTSVAEGFGMAFLEPWLANRRVVARDLPTVTSGFIAEGLELDELYPAMWIPGDPDWIARMNDRWRQSLEQAWSIVPESVRPQIDSSSVSQTAGHRSANDCLDRIDFARLTPEDQIAVLRRIQDDGDFADAIALANRPILTAIQSDGDDVKTNRNRERVEKRYHARVQLEQLENAYQELWDSSLSACTRVGEPPSTRMIDLVNHSHPFFPCRVETL